MWNRRDILRLGLTTGSGWLLSQGLSRPARAQSQPRRGGKKARYTLIVFLSGGIDATWTTDPKLQAEVAPDIKIPYAPAQIVDAGAVQLGPHFAPLAKYAGRMAVFNGVQLNTANHNTGHMQLLRLKTDVHNQMPSLLDIIGSQREGAPLACISLGSTFREDYSSGWFGTLFKSPSGDSAEKDLFGSLDELAPADLERMARVLRTQAAHLRTTSGPVERLNTARNIDETAALFEYLPRTKPFHLEVWSPDRIAQSFAESLQRALWAFENDVTACAFVQLGGGGWDTHANNDPRQALFNTAFAEQFARFMEQLDRRHNAHGGLGENTLMVVGSELGRFPRLNSVQGKDHFAEAPYLLIGPGVNTASGKGAVYGRTGKQTEALPLSLKTGREVASGGYVPKLDDLGATLLYASGIEPSVYGYSGRILDFLLAT